MQVSTVFLSFMCVAGCAETAGTSPDARPVASADGGRADGGSADGGGSAETDSGGSDASDAPAPGPDGGPTTLGGDCVPFLSFDGPAVPQNLGGDGYPTYYDACSGGSGEGGVFEASIDPTNAVLGSSLLMRITSGCEAPLYAQFNPYDGTGRGFARDYAPDPSSWEFNTYTRMRFWIWSPEGEAFPTDGQDNAYVGTYVKRVRDPDPSSDETGGFHGYHGMSLPHLGAWTLVVLNTHPSHTRGVPGATEEGNRLHPTGEAEYNYYDALTRFYINTWGINPARLPVDYRLDEIEFCTAPAPENDDQIYTITATYVASSNRLVITWQRNKDENDLVHEVRYAFDSVHAIGWDSATPAPGGSITPPGFQGYNGMTYETAALDLSGRDRIFVAIRPMGAALFSEIELPLIR